MKTLATLAALAAILPAVALAEAPAQPLRGDITCHDTITNGQPVRFDVSALDHRVSLQGGQTVTATITEFSGNRLDARGQDVRFVFEPRSGAGAIVRADGAVTPLSCKFSWA